MRCGCGIVVRGERHPGESSVVCPSCGLELPLPDASPGTLAPPPAGAVQFVPATRESVAAAAALDKRGTVAAPADEAGLHPDRLEQRRHVTSLQILAAVVLLLVVGTVAWGWYSRRQQRFLLELQDLTTAGQSALDRGEFERAVELLREADRAARGLHATDAQGQLARQLYREAMIWSRLAVSGIDEFFFARAAAAAGAGAGLPAEFDRELAGRTVVIQAHGVRTAAAAPMPPGGAAPAAEVRPEPKRQPARRPARLPLELDWLIAGERFQVKISPKDLADLPGVPENGEHELLFGAELQSVEPDPARPGGWLVRLVPQSAVLLTGEGPFASIHWPDPDSLRELLAGQRSRVLGESAPQDQEEEAAP
ncbi:MAG: hypothetical protein JNG90_18425 [Planctomycetaceae bacterium]|nr:hypothetical protein [Planctomycetaceae bacterium]